MIIVTGGAGFIGSNLIHALQARGQDKLVVVDDLSDGHKYQNLADATLFDYYDKHEFLTQVQAALRGESHELDAVRAVFHQGACSATTEWDGRFMLENNFSYSKTLFHFCQAKRIPFIYASSAAVYGMTGGFSETPAHEQPLNVYGYSKLLFDQYLRARWEDLTAQVVGLRYFNVYGPREQHKGSMASVAYHHHCQMQAGGNPKLFGAWDGYEAGMQQRDFIHVDDAIAVNLWALDHTDVSGIFNVGTGRAEPFKAIGEAVVGFYGRGDIEYIEFPEHLKNSYQSHTCADLTRLRDAGFNHEFRDVARGVQEYLSWLEDRPL